MRLFSAIFDAVLIPVAVLKDVCTLGGCLIEGEKSATREQIEKVEDDISR